MKEHLPWFAVLLIAVVAIVATAPAQAPQQDRVGRYQLVTVPGNAEEVAGVYKIDTATGKTWQRALNGQTWVLAPLLDFVPTK